MDQRQVAGGGAGRDRVQLGARQVIDYTAEDFTGNGLTYHVVYDAVVKHSFRRRKGSLKRGGIYLAANGWANLALALRPAWAGHTKVMLAIPPRYTWQDVLFVKQMIEAGTYRAVIDRRYPLRQAADAARYVETQQKTGNVVLTVDGSQAR